MIDITLFRAGSFLKISADAATATAAATTAATSDANLEAALFLKNISFE